MNPNIKIYDNSTEGQKQVNTSCDGYSIKVQ